jgi:hypothetical protein
MVLERDGRRLVITEPPGYIRDHDGRIIGVDAWVELFDEHGDEIPIDPHRRIINPPTASRGDGGPEEALWEAVWDSVTEVPNPAGWRTHGTVTTVFADTSDGYIQSLGNNYTDVQQGLGSGGFVVTTNASANYTIGQSFGSGTYRVYQTYLSFNTAAIPDTDVVTDVTLQTWLTLDNSTLADFTAQAQFQDWGATCGTEDWEDPVNFGTLLASLNTSGIGATGSYKTWTSQPAFLTVPNLKTGTVYLNLVSSRSVADIPPGTGTEYIQISPADTAGTTQDPKLVITHNAPAAHSGGSGAVVTSSAAGGGRAATSGGAATAVSTVAAAGGAPAVGTGSGAAVSTSSTGGGRPATSGAASTVLNVTAAGAGTPATSAGSAAALQVLASGAGSAATSSGAGAVMQAASAGAGLPAFTGGSAAVVLVLATGGGQAPISGGSAASIGVVAAGAGMAALSGGSGAKVAVTAAGGGQQLIVDVVIIVGPTRVLEYATAAGTRQAYDASTTRAGRDAGVTRVRELAAAGSTRSRELATAGTTRTSSSLGDTRTSTQAGPTRDIRGG